LGSGCQPPPPLRPADTGPSGQPHIQPAMGGDSSEVKQTSSVATASINLTKNLIGAGIFTLPSALLCSSVAAGLATMVFVGTVQASSFIMIAFLCQRLGAHTYRQVCAAAFGQRAGRIVDACIMTNSFFACTAYTILVADFMQKALEGLFGWQDAPRGLLIWSSTLSISLPISHARDLSPLKFTSMMGMAIIALVVMYVVQDFFRSFSEAKVNVQNHAFRLDMGIFRTLALCTGAFQAHYNSPKFFKELGCNLRNHTCTVLCSFGSAFLIYSSFAVSGLGLFGDDLLGNVLKNYPAEGNTAVLMAWLGMAFAVIFTYPLVFTTGRDSLIGLVPALQRAGKTNPTGSHVAITTSLVVVITMMACIVDDVSVVTGLLGATIGACLCWIFPAMIYLKVVLMGPATELKEPLLPGRAPATRSVQLPTAGGAFIAYAVGMVIVGCLSMFVGVSRTLGLL